MSETKTTIPNTSSGSPAGFPNDLGRTLEESQNQIDRELAEVYQIKTDPEAFLQNRLKVISEALANGKIFYKKKDYTKAFAEWEKIFPLLVENDEFKLQARKLKESYLNLMQANLELEQVKQALLQRSSPSVSDVKYLETEGQAAATQVKNVYAAMSKQLRTDRSLKKIALWKPILAVLIFSAGTLVVMKGLQGAHQVSPVVIAPAESNDSTVEALSLDHQNQVELLNRKHAEASRMDREKIIRLETQLKEAENENADLKRRVEVLVEDNLNKDNTISSLS